jgi:hypothetical protein
MQGDDMAEESSRVERPVAVPIEYAGQWIAWNQSQTRILAAGRTLPEVRQAARAAGEDRPVFAKAPRSHTRFVGRT